jgi:hypothetical protein
MFDFRKGQICLRPFQWVLRLFHREQIATVWNWTLMSRQCLIYISWIPLLPDANGGASNWTQTRYFRVFQISDLIILKSVWSFHLRMHSKLIPFHCLCSFYKQDEGNLSAKYLYSRYLNWQKNKGTNIWFYLFLYFSVYSNKGTNIWFYFWREHDC